MAPPVFENLPPGQRRVCEKLLDRRCYRYVDVATILQISAGTVRQHLARVRANHPAVYKKLMAQRRRQLAERHERAQSREDLRRGILMSGFTIAEVLEQTAYYKYDRAAIDAALAQSEDGVVIEFPPLD
jgi:transposase